MESGVSIQMLKFTLSTLSQKDSTVRWQCGIAVEMCCFAFKITVSYINPFLKSFHFGITLELQRSGKDNINPFKKCANKIHTTKVHHALQFPNLYFTLLVPHLYSLESC